MVTTPSKLRRFVVSLFGGATMMVTIRILALSLVGAALGVVIGAGLGVATCETAQTVAGLCFLLGCIGAPIGAIAGAAGEIVAALNRRPPSDDRAKLS
jgi:hypothetical protein